MEQNQTREKIAWLAVLAVVLMVSFGLFRLADATSAWLSEGDAVEEVAMNRPAPATNSVTLPAEMQQQLQQGRANPGGWASGQFTFTPGPAQQKFEKEFENFQQQKAAPQQLQQPEQQQQQKKPEAGKPQYRSVDPNESMEEFWRPDYYDEGLDL